MSKQQQSRDIAIYQLKVTLKYSSPPIWRRIQVAEDTTLGTLHRIIQVIMGWEDYHLHQFIARGTYYGVPSREFGISFGPDVANERDVKLSRIVSGEKDRFVYQYDFGDSWDHEILLEKILPPEEGVPYPTCIKGKLACPPEDVGGVWGYYGFLEAIQDPNHPEHDDMLEWVGAIGGGGSFDPEEFDLDAINKELKRIK